MQNRLWIVMLVLAVAAIPAVAGDCEDSAKDQTAANGKTEKAHHGCTADTQYCLNAMASKLKSKGWVGLEMDDSDGALTITRVEYDSPAQAAGLKKGDVLLSLNGVNLDSENKEALKAIKSEMAPGKTVTYTIARSGREKNVEVTLAEIPDAIMAKWVGRHMLEHASVEIAQN